MWKCIKATIASFHHIKSQIWNYAREDVIQKSFLNVTSAIMKEISGLHWTLIFEVLTTTYCINVNCVSTKLVKKISTDMFNSSMKEKYYLVTMIVNTSQRLMPPSRSKNRHMTESSIVVISVITKQHKNPTSKFT